MSKAVLICRQCGFASSCREPGDRCPTDDTLLLPRQTVGESRRDPSVGRLLAGRFLVLGGQVRHDMVTVYRGIDLVTGRAVSVKAVPPYAVGARERIERLTAESRLLRRMRHATLPEFVAGGREDDGLVWTVYGGMRGVSLRALLTERGPLPPNRAINITLRILAALDRLHARQRVHTDPRPENILITPRGLRGNDEIRLLDVGNTVAVGDCAAEVPDAGRGGRAPEQQSGRPLGITADIHAAGALLFEMLAGRSPFGRSTSFEPLRAGHQVPLRLTLDAEFLTLTGVVERALHPSPERRWQRARAMAIALRAAFVTRRGERPVPSSAPPTVRPPASGPLPSIDAVGPKPPLDTIGALVTLAAWG